MATPIKLPPPTICDMNCYLEPDHLGPHQFTHERQEWLKKQKERKTGMDKKTALDFLKMLDFCDSELVWPNHIWKIRERLLLKAELELALHEGE